MAQFAAWWPLAGVAAIAALFSVWWWLPKLQVRRLRFSVRDAKARADLEDNFRKTVGQLLGGAAVLVGGALAYLQFTQQQRNSQKQFTQQQQAAHDLLISNQVSKGFEQLGSDKVPVRLGGVYALEGVMNDSERYHEPVLEALCAFVRSETRTKTGDDPPATEVQAALTVIGRREKQGEKPFAVDLAAAHIPKAWLHGANLSQVDLTGANLSQANLTSANLRGSDLRTDLSHAYLDFADLSHTLMAGADLRHASLEDVDLTDVNLQAANLTDANLSGADLRQARSLTQEQLDSACGDKDTKLDPLLTIKPCPPD